MRYYTGYGLPWFEYFPMADGTTIMIMRDYGTVANDKDGYYVDDCMDYDWFEGNTGDYKEMSQWYEHLRCII